MNEGDRVFIAGHRGLVGSAVFRRFEAAGFRNLLVATRAELDLTDQRAVHDFFAATRPDHVVLAAAKVGGIQANDRYPGEFIRDNLLIQTNVIDAAYRHGVKKFVFLGSSCIYPRDADQPMPETALLTGALEPTNEWYAVAKIAGIKMCQAYRRQFGFDAICLMPTNLFGPGDNFDLENSHVLPALIRRFHEAKLAGRPELTVWGSGEPRREFLHVDDLADAVLFLARNYSGATIVNVGVGRDISIAELAGMVSEVVGFQGRIVFDRSKPDGTPRKLLDVTELTRLGWTARISLREGLQSTYSWYVAQGGEAIRGLL